MSVDPRWAAEDLQLIVQGHGYTGDGDGTAAQVLQRRLEERWKMGPEDRDMIAMLHKIEYELDGRAYREQSSMVTLGTDPVRTAMAKTVGLTAAIGATAILDGTIAHRGVQIPNSPGVYRMMNAKGDVLYVGKAKSLKKRVASYAKIGGHTNRIARMIAETVAMEFMRTRTETEALVAELRARVGGNPFVVENL